MQTINRYLADVFLPEAIASSCPASIPTSGEEGAKVDCYYVHQMKGATPFLVFIGLEAGILKALEFDGKSYALDRSIPLKDIDPSLVRITHYYRLATITYEGIGDFARGRILRIPYMIIAIHRMLDGCTQWLFNRRALVVKNRLEVLRDSVDLAQCGNSSLSSLDLMTKRYGYRWASYPRWESHSNEIQFYLDGLVDTGELKKVNFDYVPTGQAFRTLEEADEQDRKHRANLRVQILLAILALFSAIAAAAQAGMFKFPTLLDFTR